MLRCRGGKLRATTFEVIALAVPSFETLAQAQIVMPHLAEIPDLSARRVLEPEISFPSVPARWAC